MGKRGPQKKEGSNTALLSIRLPEAARTLIVGAMTPAEIREALVEAARKKKIKKENIVDKV